MAMVAVGASIGTGLLLGSGAAMEVAGPAVILSFLIAAFSNFAFAMALGELACAHPAAGSFGVYGDLYLNPFCGFLARSGYWVGIALNIGAEMVAASTYMAYWFPGVRSYIWVLIFSVVLLIINLRSVKSYGQFEFWFSMIKLVTIVGFILIGASLLLTGRVTPQYTTQGGFFAKGTFAPLIAMTYAVFSFGGGEIVAVTSGESRSTKEVRRAVWMTLLTLTLVYVGAVTVLVGVMPWNHAGVTESPFVTTFRLAKIPHISGIMNFVVLSAALSGANACLYAGSRLAFSLARTGWAPASFGRLNHEGSPRNAVLITSFGIPIALVTLLWVPGNAFRYLVGAAFTGLIASYLVSLAAHISFRRRRSSADLASLTLRSPLGMFGSILGFVVISISLIQTWLVPRVNLWSGLACLLALTLVYFSLRYRVTEKWR
jgi:L-asparagine transporter-like permease